MADRRARLFSEDVYRSSAAVLEAWRAGRERERALDRQIIATSRSCLARSSQTLRATDRFHTFGIRPRRDER